MPARACRLVVLPRRSSSAAGPTLPVRKACGLRLASASPTSCSAASASSRAARCRGCAPGRPAPCVARSPAAAWSAPRPARCRRPTSPAGLPASPRPGNWRARRQWMRTRWRPSVSSKRASGVDGAITGRRWGQTVQRQVDAADPSRDPWKVGRFCRLFRRPPFAAAHRSVKALGGLHHRPQQEAQHRALAGADLGPCPPCRAAPSAACRRP